MLQPSRKSLASTTNRLVLAWKLDPSERNFRRVERHYRPFFKNLVKRIHSEEVREDLLQEPGREPEEGGGEGFAGKEAL